MLEMSEIACLIILTRARLLQRELKTSDQEESVKKESPLFGSSFLHDDSAKYFCVEGNGRGAGLLTRKRAIGKKCMRASEKLVGLFVRLKLFSSIMPAFGQRFFLRAELTELPWQP